VLPKFFTDNFAVKKSLDLASRPKKRIYTTL